MPSAKYNKEELVNLIAKHVSFTDVLRELGVKPVGGSIHNLSLRCKRLGIDTSHMTGSRHGLGKPSKNRRSAEELLKKGSVLDHRTHPHRLRRAMIEKGVLFCCNSCGIDGWHGKRLMLEIDHIDGQYWNNEIHNLQFLCPNCHSLKVEV